ncbi:MAG TPA: aconitase/3-isopropylmalate dehydratase large subunit family protein [Gemmatimonadaceae bacterium]
MTARTISEKILSARSGRDARAGDVVVCDVDLVLGTDASSPMAIDYFHQMGGTKLFDATKVVFALDHYAPPETAATRGFHERIQSFAKTHGAQVRAVGDGISFQVAMETGRVRPGDLVIGADSHTVTCGALGAFATGVGSSDLAAAMITGQMWLRVPETIRVTLTGTKAANISAKDIALEMVRRLGAEGANYRALEFYGAAVASLSVDDRMVICNLAVECGAKAAMFPNDGITSSYLGPRTYAEFAPIVSDAGAQYAQELEIDLSALSPQIALPHAPDNVKPLAAAEGTPIHMVFLGTCTGGRADDFREALRVIQKSGGRIARGVTLVLTPSSRDVHNQLTADGTLARFQELGAIVTTPGCGACCGTSGVIPTDGMNVISTANRNFKARMGNATASIYLASPAACAAAAVAGKIVELA